MSFNCCRGHSGGMCAPASPFMAGGQSGACNAIIASTTKQRLRVTSGHCCQNSEGIGDSTCLQICQFECICFVCWRVQNSDMLRHADIFRQAGTGTRVWRCAIDHESGVEASAATGQIPIGPTLLILHERLLNGKSGR